MNILVTGSNGLLGQHLVVQLLDAGYEVFGVGRGENRLKNTGKSFHYHNVDITDGLMLRKAIENIRPDVVIHAAAMTQVDDCETDKQECYNINVTATRFLIDALREFRARLIYISTDFVFDGMSGPYGEEDEPSPVNYYGSTKLAAEHAVTDSKLSWAIVRTVLVFGEIISGTRSNIISWVKNSLKEGKSIKVVADQWRTPTYVKDLAHGVLLLVKKEATGIFHISGKDMLTPYDIAIKTARLSGLDESLIQKADSTVFVQKGQRPSKTGFYIDKARRELGYEPRSFEEALKETLGVNG